jgi:aminoglycoside phosphotransferase (APT) family kinase protein
MEFIKGRIITDPNLSTLSPTERRSAWFSLVSTLAWLHSIDPDSIGLSDFGKKTGFYTRHCNTFSRIEAQQAKVKDIKTGKELGRAHPNFDEIIDYVRKNVPSDRTSIVHGDYKFDNVILHPTEPRVIAILDWELSTIGHPLMDTVYIGIVRVQVASLEVQKSRPETTRAEKCTIQRIRRRMVCRVWMS